MGIKVFLKKNKRFVKIYKNTLDIYYSFLTLISPKLNTKVLYKKRFGQLFNLKNPTTLNEKILKLKLDSYATDLLVRQCADKFAVRAYVEDIGCGELLIPLIATYDRVEQIDWKKLPETFVMKWNYGSGFNILCSDKSKLDIPKTIKQLKKWQKDPYYLVHSEMQYKNVKKKIIVEEFLTSDNGFVPDDYKFYCFNGRVEYILVCTNRHKGNDGIVANYVFFDRQWCVQPFSQYAIECDCKVDIQRPKNLDMAIEYAEKLSSPFKFVRTDLYLCGSKIYFGELTFTPAGGLDTDLFSGDRIMGELLKL